MEWAFVGLSAVAWLTWWLWYFTDAKLRAAQARADEAERKALWIATEYSRLDNQVSRAIGFQLDSPGVKPDAIRKAA